MKRGLRPESTVLCPGSHRKGRTGPCLSGSVGAPLPDRLSVWNSRCACLCPRRSSLPKGTSSLRLWLWIGSEKACPVTAQGIWALSPEKECVSWLPESWGPPWPWPWPGPAEWKGGRDGLWPWKATASELRCPAPRADLARPFARALQAEAPQRPGHPLRWD